MQRLPERQRELTRARATHRASLSFGRLASCLALASAIGCGLSPFHSRCTGEQIVRSEDRAFEPAVVCAALALPDSLSGWSDRSVACARTCGRDFNHCSILDQGFIDRWNAAGASAPDGGARSCPSPSPDGGAAASPSTPEPTVAVRCEETDIVTTFETECPARDPSDGPSDDR